MRDTDLYAQILGVHAPWQVTAVELRIEAGEVEVSVDHTTPESLVCPECGRRARRYDTRKRSWRHLPTCQYRTVLSAEVPRVRCSEHGVKTIGVPWSDPGSGFTALFEALIIDWRLAANTSAVAKLLGLTWDEVDGVMQRAVRRGLDRRELTPARCIGVDETSFQKRHEYVTVVADLEKGVVHHVSDGQDSAALESYYGSLSSEALAAIEQVAMDMSAAYIAATEKALPEAHSKIAFDKFHVAMNLGKAVDQVRRDERRRLVEMGDSTLKGTLHLWRVHPDRLTPDQVARLKTLARVAKQTARAWEPKELAMMVWDCSSKQDAEEFFEAWYKRAIRSRLRPVRRIAKTLRKNLYGVLNAIVSGVTNARLEGINNVIQGLKRSARGFRNRERFRTAIYFHLGGLSLYPRSLAHTNS
jgi:transposase